MTRMPNSSTFEAFSFFLSLYSDHAARSKSLAASFVRSFLWPGAAKIATGERERDRRRRQTSSFNGLFSIDRETKKASKEEKEKKTSSSFLIAVATEKNFSAESPIFPRAAFTHFFFFSRSFLCSLSLCLSHLFPLSSVFNLLFTCDTSRERERASISSSYLCGSGRKNREVL